MTPIKNARCDTGAAKAGRLFEAKYTQTLSTAQPLAGPRFERQVERLHNLGPRPLAEILAEIAAVTGRPDIVADRLQAYAQLDPEILRAVGADRFPPMALEVVG